MKTIYLVKRSKVVRTKRIKKKSNGKRFDVKERNKINERDFIYDLGGGEKRGIKTC